MGSRKTKVEAPPARNYYREVSDTLQAQMDLAPDLYASEEQWRGKYAQLDLDIATQIAPGLLDLYETSQRRIGALDREQLTAQREADIASVEQLGGRAKAAFDAANPEQAALMAELNRQALSDLRHGGRLNASEQRELQQAARGAQAARGFGYGINDAAIESWAQLQGSERKQRERQQFAQSMVGLNQSTSADPFMAILGRPSSLSPSMNQIGGGFAGQAQSFNPGAMFSPESQYAGDIYNQNWQGQLAARTASAKNRGSIFGSAIGAIGKVGSAIALGCWVAREVYGENNPKWLMFREWMFTDAPNWFYNLYLKHGEQFAQWLRKHPWLKPVIRKFMDSKIKG
tara:strand:- start:70 stop:1101 length:1032 start_codon:yes stop_codon:yes gene_type:complete